MEYYKTNLPNGLRILTIPMQSVQSATILVMVGVGSRYEEKEINGISHFLEHMAFKGAKKRPSALAIASTIDGIGGEFNAFTTKDHTGYYIKAAQKHIPLLLDVLSDMLLHSKFDPEEIEKERGVIIEEINMYEDTPMRRVGDLYENLLYGDTKLGRDIAGRKDVIKRVQRKDFLSYIDRFYSPVNTVVCIAGGMGTFGSPHTITPVVAQYLESWKAKDVPPADLTDDRQDAPSVLVHYKDTQQAHLCIGVRSYHLTHPARFKLAVLSSILGGGMSSRLFIEVRERRGLAYYIRSTNEQYADVGNFVTQAGVDVSRIDAAISVILNEFHTIKEENVTDEELSKAKEHIKGRITLELEDSKFVASLYASSELLEGRIKTPQEILRMIDDVTRDDVLDVAHDIFKEHTLNLTVIGPYKDKDRFRKLLHF